MEQYKREYDLESINKEFAEWIKKQTKYSNGEKAYHLIDQEGRVYRKVSMAWPNKKRAPDEYFEPLIHPITHKPCPIPARGWRNPPETMQELLDKQLIIFGDNELKQPERKYFLDENLEENLASIIPFGGSDDELLKHLGIPFDNPKPVDFATELLECFTNKSSLILDFFAGSGTTGQAVLEMNKEDGGNRKFILIQQPEESKKATEGGFKNIFEITTTRIRRCIEGVPTAKDPKLKEGLGGSFTVVKLGEALHLNTLFLEKDLPSYEALASYLFYHTTNQALNNVTENTSHYIGKTENYKLYLIYSADREKLKHPDYALSRSKLEQILKDCGNGYQALIYAVTIYVDNKSIKSLMEKEEYTKKPIICQIPYQYLQINSANVLNNLEDSED